jgi:hypothetical protein
VVIHAALFLQDGIIGAAVLTVLAPDEKIL